MERDRGYGIECHYNTSIILWQSSFIGGGNQGTWTKPPT